jgi:hypothetical protein
MDEFHPQAIELRDTRDEQTVPTTELFDAMRLVEEEQSHRPLLIFDHSPDGRV